MKHLLIATLLASVSLTAAPTPVDAGVMSRACMKSDRKAANRRMCRCLQKVADRELRRGEQKLAASFFEDPHKAQEVRQSDRSSDERFWRRYKKFGQSFSKSCGHLK